MGGPYGVDWAAAAAGVRRRLAACGRDAPGNCMWAAGFGAAELRGLGVRAVVNAGTCAYRRLPEPEAHRRGGAECFGYEWDPDAPLSVAAMARGLMPEYHAWCAVQPGTPGFPAAGLIVDFSARWFPEVCRGGRAGFTCATAPRGMTWETPPPADPELIAPGDVAFGPLGGVVRAFYAADPEATAFCVLAARLVARKAVLVGELTPALAADLQAALGGKPLAADRGYDRAAMTVSAADILRVVRRRTAATGSPFKAAAP